MEQMGRLAHTLVRPHSILNLAILALYISGLFSKLDFASYYRVEYFSIKPSIISFFQTQDECRKLDTSPRYGGRSWASMQPLPTPLASFSMAASTTSVYTFGGRTSATQCTASVHKYDIAGNTWTADFSALPSGTPSYGHCQAESDNGDFWIIGG